MGVNKNNSTLSSISIIVIVIVIAMIALLVGNYTKNSNSGIELEYRLLDLKPIETNEWPEDNIKIIDSISELGEITQASPDSSLLGGDSLIISIIGAAQPNAGYIMKLDRLAYRGNDINLQYSIDQPEADTSYIEIITSPSLFLQLDKNSLPIGTELNFNFINSTTKTRTTINYTIKI